MSESLVVQAITVFDLLLLAGILGILPGAARRGLLFGAHVGVEADGSEAARGLRSRWRSGLWLLLAASLSLTLLLGASGRPLAGCFGSLALFLVGGALLYVHVHRAARELAPVRSGAPLPAPEAADSPGSMLVPLAALAVCLVAGTWSVIEAASLWPSLPERIPTHFGGGGRPDAWSTKSFATVFALPLMNLVLGSAIAGFALLTSRARLSLRGGGGERELRAQLGFRRATVHLLAGTAAICSGMLFVLSHEALQVATGARSSLSSWIWLFAGLLVVCVFGTTGRLIWFHGQGGSRREGGAVAEPLTDGLADDRHWKWGVLYVNRDDPAVLVEKRFGIGYTVNFGNRWAVVMLAAFLAALFGILALSLWGTAR